MNRDEEPQPPYGPRIDRRAASLNPEEEVSEAFEKPTLTAPTFIAPPPFDPASDPASEEPDPQTSTGDETAGNAAPSAAFLTPQDREALNRLEANRPATNPVPASNRLEVDPMQPRLVAMGRPELLPEPFPIGQDGGKNAHTASTTDAAVDARIRQLSRRSFVWSAAALVGGYVAWKGLNKQPTIDGIGWPFRLAHEVNERLARDYFQASRLAPTFPKALAQPPKANGHYGLGEDFEPKGWKLKVVGLKTEEEAPASRLFTLADIKKLPPTEMVTELKCIEGWSVIVQWVGVRFADFIAKYPPAPIDDQPPQYVGMTTPDGEYFVGLDMESAMHPQTLLCYEMNGKPLTLEHGAPLRLVIPVKYGIKNIKRIGTIHFSNDRPKDYWAKEGYDWYSGH